MRILVLFLFTALLWSCRKESFTTDAASRLTLFTDSLHFDTVFTQTGSATRSFKIFNNNSKGVRIQSISLGGGTASPFRLNVNGEPGALIQNIELASGDSAYVFVSVTINPNAAQQPFVVQDSIEIAYNGNREVVQLQAYGQNARFVRRRTITENETWNSSLPYVILEPLEVAPGAALTIEKGTRIYVHASATITIGGSLVVQGGKDSSERVRFSGDRLDEPYRDFPGAWPGLRFKAGSTGNKIQYAHFQNSVQALVLESNVASGAAQLYISETIIDGAADAGIFSQGGNINGRNLLVSNSAKGVVLAGGQALFEHCTVAGYNTRYLPRKEPLVQLGNTAVNGSVPMAVPLTATFRNCIIWGGGQNIEIEVALAPTAGLGFSVLFDHVLWKMAAAPAETSVISAIVDEPLFVNTEGGSFDFRLQQFSPAVDKGKASAVNIDLDGKGRPVGVPDLGAYEQ